MPVLMTSVHDTVRNEAAKQRREDLRIQAELEEKRKNESEMDYLAPFLAQMGDPAELNRAQAKQLKEDALHDLKTRLINQANMIQERFDRETGQHLGYVIFSITHNLAQLRERQNEYHERQNTMTKADEESYRNACSDGKFMYLQMAKFLLI